MEKMYLKEMIDQKVIEEMAAKYKIKVSDQDVDVNLECCKLPIVRQVRIKVTNEKKWKEQIRNSLLLEEILTRDVRFLKRK